MYSTCMNIYMYICIYIERERERDLHRLGEESASLACSTATEAPREHAGV